MLLDGDYWQPVKNLGIKLKLEKMVGMGIALFKQTFNDDWHTKLRVTLSYAKERTSSPTILAAIEALQHQLAQNDECIHTVTATQAVPPGMDVSFLMKQIQESTYIQPATLGLTPDGEIELTITTRGTREHVVGVAKFILKNGLLEAESQTWAASMVRSGRVFL